MSLILHLLAGEPLWSPGGTHVIDGRHVVHVTEDTDITMDTLEAYNHAVNTVDGRRIFMKKGNPADPGPQPTAQSSDPPVITHESLNMLMDRISALESSIATKSAG